MYKRIYLVFIPLCSVIVYDGDINANIGPQGVGTCGGWVGSLVLPKFCLKQNFKSRSKIYNTKKWTTLTKENSQNDNIKQTILYSKQLRKNNTR